MVPNMISLPRRKKHHNLGDTTSKAYFKQVPRERKGTLSVPVARYVCLKAENKI